MIVLIERMVRKTCELFHRHTIWSPLIPLGWFVNSVLTKAKGQAWPDDMCKKFEPSLVSYRWANVACPCSAEEVRICVCLMLTNLKFAT